MLRTSIRKLSYNGGYNVRIRVVFPSDADRRRAVLASVARATTLVETYNALAAISAADANASDDAPATTNPAKVVNGALRAHHFW